MSETSSKTHTYVMPHTRTLCTSNQEKERKNRDRVRDADGDAEGYQQTQNKAG